jgi:hypothetical protein
MLVFIHANFKLDLTYLNVTFSEQNSWFKDQFSTEFSFPFDLYLDSDFSKNSGFEAHYNATNKASIYNGILDRDGFLIDAFLEFQSIKGKTISAVINAGLADFPSFNKKLSQLLLEIKTVENIIEDASEIIKIGYPETNYNYPMMHTDKYDPASKEWNEFGKIINQYRNGSFVENELVPETNLDKINNIIQPLPYLIYVVKKAIEYAGYTLTGDILNDVDFNRALIWRDGDYYERSEKLETPFAFKNKDWNSIAYTKSRFEHVLFEKEITVNKKGDYIVFGSIFNLRYRYTDAFGTAKNATDISIVIYKNNTIIYQSGISGNNKNSNTKYQLNYTVELDLAVSLESGDKIRIRKIEPRRDATPSQTPDYPEAISLKIIPVRLRNPDGSPILSVLNLKEVDLNRVVPDMSVTEVITALKNWKNYDFTNSDKVISMNLIKSKLDRANAVDFSLYDIEEPERIFHQDREFELSFTDGQSNDVYKYDTAIINKSGITINGIAASDEINEIKIDALPLPVINRNSIITAYTLDDQSSKLRLVFMNPVPEGGSPVAFHNDNVLIPAVAENDFKYWLNFRINSEEWKWNFLISVEKFREISIQTLIYAYGNYHVISTIEKERLDHLWYNITAQTESLL